MKRNFACWRSAELDPDGRYRDGIRRVPAIHSDAAIAFLLREIEVAMQLSWHGDCVWQIGFVNLDFLHAHAIGILSREPAEETLRDRGADAVEV
jgi:hypothetical protein